jgi:hypothetical protein
MRSHQSPKRELLYSGLIALALVSAPCTPGTRANMTDRPQQEPWSQRSVTLPKQINVVVTRDNLTYPQRCRPRAVGRTVAGLLRSVTDGDWVALNRFLEEEPEFGWYSVTDGVPRGPRRHFVAYNRDRLDSYFKARHAIGERVRLLAVDVVYDPDRNLGHIAYVLRRRAPDLAEIGITGTLADGKGAVDCQDGRVRVWSMGMDESPRYARGTLKVLCPLPPAVDWTRTAVACARN